MTKQQLPKVAVCLAAYNGIFYLHEQLTSILMQSDIAVTLFVSVDSSSDGTEAWIESQAQKDSRIEVLQLGEYFGNAAGNFYRLIKEVDFSNFDYISFADQDDIWQNDKLIRHIRLIRKNNVDGVSSNVIAFWPNGKTKLIDKSQQQRELDYLFESAGPGCTFLMTPWLVSEAKKLLIDSSSVASQVALHDWLVYAVCRASGKKWLIDSNISMQYRQHGKNVVGANSGLKAKLGRLKQISNGWYRQEVLKVLDVSCSLSNDHQLQTLKKILQTPGLKSRLSLLTYVQKTRRRFYDRLILGIMILIGLF